MGLIEALRRPRLALLWGSQVLSSIGDQLYTVAVIWLAVELAGSRGGLVAGAQSASALVFSTLGGVYADRWDRRVTMVLTDAARAVAVLSLSVMFALGLLQLWHLLLVAVVLGGLGSVFNPALQASLPALAGDPRTLNATNALMDITRRLARVLGPGLAGLLIAVIPLGQFFTLDGVSFVLSALALVALRGSFTWRSTRPAGGGRRFGGSVSEIAGAIRLVLDHRLLRYMLGGLLVLNAAWGVAFTLGAALLAARVLHDGIGAYGLIVGAYGLGNVVANIAVGSVHVRRRSLTMFRGKVVLGAAFLLLAVPPSLPVAMAGAALAAIGGPMADLPLLSIIQLEFPSAQIGKVASLRILTEEAGTLVGLLLAPVLFSLFPVRVTIAMAAVVMAMIGVGGLCIFGTKRDSTAISPEPRVV